ncbi:putative sulfate exporter family transporter [Cupriavidus sp. TMH.W2]|uniref:putative sulfate exporter family transporter n=1 Tax=Cupriavidus sp. TMH.W2 TaxID=3434465 RepID=UPI003D77C121
MVFQFAEAARKGYVLGTGQVLVAEEQHPVLQQQGLDLNDTSSVVAAAYAWNATAGEYATIVKLTRAMMIVPVVVVIAMLYRRERANGSIRRSVPWFIVMFVAASATNRWLPAPLNDAVRLVAPLLIVGALTAIGLSTDIARLRRAGWRPLLLGLLFWVSVAASSLLMQKLTGAL